MIELYPVTASNATLWILAIVTLFVGLWHIVPLLFHKFVPPGYKHDKELDALVQDCASLAHPAGNLPKDCKQKIPRGFTRNDVIKKCPIPKAKKYQIIWSGGLVETFDSELIAPTMWDWGVCLNHIVAYKVLDKPKKATTKAKKATKKPAKKVTMRKKNGKLPKVQKRKVR